MTGARCKVVDGFVAAGDGKIVDESDRVEAAVRDAEAPNEVLDVGDVFLVGFWSKDDHG